MRAALQKLIQQDPQAKERVCAFENAANATHFAMNSQQAIQAVYGENLYLSPSRIESFHRCRFAYFLRYALGLKERKRAELSPIETGSVIHYVLEQVLAAYSPQELNALKKPQLLDILQRILEQYLQEQMAAKGQGERFVYLFNRLQDTVYKLVRHLVREFLQSDFAPYAFEMDVGHREDVSPLHVKTADGQDVWVSGFIDRVDVMEQNGRKYVRVIDYKTGTKSFQLSDVFYGLNMQMLLYLFAIWQNGQKGLKNAYPAGILYCRRTTPSPLPRARTTRRAF